jgi:hypothetical protein
MAQTMTGRRIKLMADYGGAALWRMDGEAGVIELEEVAMSEGLRADLQRWVDRYDATLNAEEPEESGFASEAEGTAFNAEGVRLWGRLREELPGDEIHYFCEESGKLMAPPEG